MEFIFDTSLLQILKILVVAFIAILFLQSGFDKVFDFKGNLSYIKSVFSKTFLASTSSIMFVVITILEVSSGVVSALGVLAMLFKNQETLAILGLELSAISLICLFFGQRIAKDYAGAVSLVSYFMLLVFGLFLFGLKS